MSGDIGKSPGCPGLFRLMGMPTTGAPAGRGLVVVSADWASNLARPESLRVHVGIRGAGANRPDEFVELTGVDTLAGYGEHLSRPNCPGDCSRLRTSRRDACRIKKRRNCLTKPDDDAANSARLPEVYVRLGHRSHKARVADLVVDHLVPVVDRRCEPSAGRGRDRPTQRWQRSDEMNLVVTRKPSAHGVANIPVIVGQLPRGPP